MMDKLKKYELMAKISRELEDLKNSLQAVLEKIGKVEVDNLELGDKMIEQYIPKVFMDSAEALDAIKKTALNFSDKTTQYAQKHDIDKLREQHRIQKLK